MLFLASFLSGPASHAQPANDDNDGSCTPGGPSTADADSDGFCDLGDNCPHVSNASQENNDSLPAGDLCQCGDLDDDGVVDSVDLELVRKVIVGSSGASSAVLARCNVTGLSDGGVSDCDLQDAFVIDRHVSGYASDIQDVCDAYQP
jgi:hypothetical protein